MGPREGNHRKKLRNLTPAELEAKLPKLRPDNYKWASQATGRYNCLAFANDSDRKWWEPGLFGGRFDWPAEDIPNTLEGWVTIFSRQGYELTSNREIEPGFEKVAIYVDQKDFDLHVAKSNGVVWKSKLGRYQDIEHSSLDLLEGHQAWEYGIVERILRRPIKKVPSPTNESSIMKPAPAPNIPGERTP